MRVPRALTLAALATLGAACSNELPPQGQLVVHLDTDAPLRPGMFDRVLVEIFPPGQKTPCPECTRELPLDVEKLRAGDFSFGFVPSPRVVGYVARLRLFRSAGRATPRRASTIELVGYLPAVAEDGVVHLAATFATDGVGEPRGTLDAPVVFEKRVPVPSAEGTWPLSPITTCEREPPPGASCVEGGPFFMGDPRVTVTSELQGGAAEHLVVLSPFFLDHHEVTIAELRASGVAVVDSRGRALDPIDDLRDGLGSCSYSVAPGPYDDRPVNCVSWNVAREYCRTKGGDLPTEAQLEIVASARGTRLFPWGDYEPSCTEAVTARNRLVSAGGCDDRDPTSLVTRLPAAPPGSGTVDRVGEIVDLGANLAEWTRDAFMKDASSCWAKALLVDPVCDVVNAPMRSTKGGDLVAEPLPFAQARRAWSAEERVPSPPVVGFRCAYPGK